MLNYSRPMIERIADGEAMYDSGIMAQIQERQKIAQVISGFLRKEESSDGYYRAIGKLLRQMDYRRLLLYLPLADLEPAPSWFRDLYLEVWYELLDVHDARENFFEGDTFEMDARPNGKLERIVKCVHLAPWLIKAGYLGYRDLRNILVLNQDNVVLLRSFANIWRFVHEHSLLPETQIKSLASLTMGVTQRAKLEPLYISKNREKWLQEKNRQSRQGVSPTLLTPQADLAGPFSRNIGAFRSELEGICSSLAPDEIVLVGGSRLKGYGLEDADFDVYSLQRLSEYVETVAGNPHATHFYFNTIWLGGEAVRDLSERAAACAAKYFGRLDRHYAAEKLENDLLQYRLLHKGFSRFYGGHDSAARGYAEMDGDCPFYDDGYRRIATELFAKYIFIPN